MVNKYIKKPLEIEAIQWTGGNLQDCIQFLGHAFEGHNAERSPNGKSEIKVNTLEGVMIASKGDFLIKGIAGEFYPCKPHIFEESYILSA